jgi:hypothetical protein
MDARTIERASIELQGLREAEWSRLGLGGAALGLAVMATSLAPSLAVPLFVGGLVVVAAGVRALWQHWDLVDRLAAERDAYVISEVRAYAAREATMGRRRAHAATIRSLLRSELPPTGVTAVVAEELEALARDLEDERLALDPASAFACARLLGAAAPLHRLASVAELRATVVRIRAGLRPAEHSAPHA